MTEFFLWQEFCFDQHVLYQFFWTNFFVPIFTIIIFGSTIFCVRLYFWKHFFGTNIFWTNLFYQNEDNLKEELKINQVWVFPELVTAQPELLRFRFRYISEPKRFRNYTNHNILHNNNNIICISTMTLFQQRLDKQDRYRPGVAELVLRIAVLKSLI